MDITCVTSYLVHPGKGERSPIAVRGTLLPLSGSLFRMLAKVFSRSDSECQIPIRFLSRADGAQNNEVRTDLVGFIESPSVDAGMQLANRLRDCTTRRSGLGLFFVMLGRENQTFKVLLSRFPADEGVVAEAREGALQVEFIERVFMKRAASYKAAFYEGSSFDSDFWSGFAVDRQLNRMAEY